MPQPNSEYSWFNFLFLSFVCFNLTQGNLKMTIFFPFIVCVCNFSASHPICLTDLREKVKCTVFPQNPWEHINERKIGVVLWIPESIEELIQTAKEKLQFSNDSCILLSENGGKILDVNMISNDQKLFLVNEAPYLEIS